MGYATGANGALAITRKPTTVGGIKLQLPAPLTYKEYSKARACTYHSTVSILEHQSLLSCPQMILALAKNVDYPFVGEQSI